MGLAAEQFSLLDLQDHLYQEGVRYHASDFSSGDLKLPSHYELAYLDLKNEYKRGDLAGIIFLGNDFELCQGIMAKLNADVMCGRLPQRCSSLPLEVFIFKEHPDFTMERKFDKENEIWIPGTNNDYTHRFWNVNPDFYSMKFSSISQELKGEKEYSNRKEQLNLSQQYL